MNLPELQQALRRLRLGTMAESLEARILQAQSERVAPIDFISMLVNDELTRRADRLLVGARSAVTYDYARVGGGTRTTRQGTSSL